MYHSVVDTARLSHIAIVSSSAPSSRPACTKIRFRWFRLVCYRYWVPYFFLLCFTATTPFSTTFSLKASITSSNSIKGTGSESKNHPSILNNNDKNKFVEYRQGSGNINSPIANDHIDENDKEVDETTKDDGKRKNHSEGEIEEGDEEKMQAVVDDQKFKQRILASIRTVQNWDADVELLQECRTRIPWEDLRNATGPYSNPEDDRLLVDNSNALFLQRFCRWFQKFMSWVNTPPCLKCGGKGCEMKTVRGPETAEEKEGGAKRVEVYYCPECKENTTTFPRYNKAKKLLETKKGRCGEYSNLFGLFCRSVGFETRLVLDLSDHLWTEVRLGDSWIMADSCEGIIDKASMYEYGWGKDGLCYMIAIAKDHVVDVTPRYTRKFLTDDFQTRRRSHTTSENTTSFIIQEVNQEIKQNQTMSTSAIEDLDRRSMLEDAELQMYKQSREWTQQEKYGRGRISGSLAWKQSRQEAGKMAKKENEKNVERDVAGFEVEAFSAPMSVSPMVVSLQVQPNPTSRHDGILVANTPCAVGDSDSISVVVVDDSCLGCILQSQSFLTWAEVKDFVDRLPSHRIVIMNGKCSESPNTKNVELTRLGGWKGESVSKHGVVFVGQVGAHPNWAFCNTLENCPPEGYEVELQAESQQTTKLRTERYMVPQRVACRLPESIMPLKTQLMASEEQKRLAFTSFTKSNAGRYSGYTTKYNAPVYLLDATAYPFSKIDSITLDVVTKEHAWNTFHYLPAPLVSVDDEGLSSKASTSDIPQYTIPLERDFFDDALGLQLMKNSSTRLPTAEALHDSRLIGLYFSAHWCGPCRSFTPMLAEMYDHLKEHRPTHGLEIVLVSSDRDANSFQQYHDTMPWQAIPFEHLQVVKQRLNMTYGVRGIPSLVVLDAISGQVVVPPNESRRAVAMACRGGEQQIEAMLDAWLQRTPQESKEILSMLELSCQEDNEEVSSAITENPYLLVEPKSNSPADTAARIKELFERLLSGGDDPTSAAAKAIGMVAEEQKPKLLPGPLDGRATRTGAPLVKEPLDEAMASAMEWNAPSLVADVLTTAMKYLKNASKEPWSPKFRTFKLSNKVADQITRVEGGLALLEGLGFEVFSTSQEFKATIPVSADLEVMKETISRLIEQLGAK